MGLEFDLCGFITRLGNYQLITGLFNEWYSEEVEKRKKCSSDFFEKCV